MDSGRRHSTLTIPWFFRNTGFGQNLHRCCRAKVHPVLQNPYDLFSRRDFNQLGRSSAASARTQDGIAVIQPHTALGTGNPGIL